MRRWILTMLLASSTLGNTGCILNMWSSDPNIRMEQLLNVSEDLRNMEYEMRRFWMNDQPSHLSPIRTHGGIGN